MSTINNFSDYTSQYNTNQDYSSLFSGMQGGTTTNSFSLSDYATIKNGSYKKLLKAYYNKQDTDKTSSDSKKVSEDKKSKMIKDSADTLKKAADALNDKSLWEKKKIKKTDEEKRIYRN